MKIAKPTILRRYCSTFIDWLLEIGMLILISYIFQKENTVITIIRVGIILVIFFTYEPIFTAYFHTLGQRITGIRIRDVTTKGKISIARSYLRYIVKISLGLISFFTILFSKDKRAIHDFAASSLVVYK